MMRMHGSVVMTSMRLMDMSVELIADALDHRSRIGRCQKHGSRNEQHDAGSQNFAQLTFHEPFRYRSVSRKAMFIPVRRVFLANRGSTGNFDAPIIQRTKVSRQLRWIQA